MYILQKCSKISVLKCSAAPDTSKLCEKNIHFLPRNVVIRSHFLSNISDKNILVYKYNIKIEYVSMI